MDVGKVAVTEDDGMGIAFLEVLEHKQQGSFLCRSTGVIILALFIDATLVADADAAVVVAFHVGTCLVFRTAGEDVAVAVDVPVVPYPTPPLGLVPVVEILDTDTLAQSGSGAMHH